MWWLDGFSTYLYGLSAVATAIALLMLVSGVDDLFIDAAYWSHRLWKSLVIYRKYERTDYQELYGPAEKPLAITSATRAWVSALSAKASSTRSRV